MANTDVTLDNEAYLVDSHSGTASENITGGSNIYLRAISTTYPFSSLIAAKPKILVDPERTGATSESVPDNWSRRKSPVSYQGVDRLIVTVEGLIDLDSPGSASASYQFATVGRLWKMWTSPGSMPFGYFDSKIGSALMHTTYDPTLGSPWANGSIPMSIKDLTFGWDKTTLNKITYTLILWEDKE